MRSRSLIALTIFTAAVGMVTAPAAAQTERAAGNYSWSGELVALDEGAKTITLKSRLVGDALAQVKTFKAGDRVLLHWSGFDTTADAVRGVMAYDGAKASKDRFLFPAELVSPETPHDYATFRFRVPDDAIGAVTSLKPGEWVTVTSKHRPASETEVVVSVRPYAQTAT